jgi:hypothetical protein
MAGPGGIEAGTGDAFAVRYTKLPRGRGNDMTPRVGDHFMTVRELIDLVAFLRQLPGKPGP